MEMGTDWVVGREGCGRMTVSGDAVAPLRTPKKRRYPRPTLTINILMYVSDTHIEAIHIVHHRSPHLTHSFTACIRLVTDEPDVRSNVCCLAQALCTGIH